MQVAAGVFHISNDSGIGLDLLLPSPGVLRCGAASARFRMQQRILSRLFELATSNRWSSAIVAASFMSENVNSLPTRRLKITLIAESDP